MKTLYRLDDTTLYTEYGNALYDALKNFLLNKQAGHCQRVDYLPKPVMEGLGKRLSKDKELRAAQVECRVVSDRGGALEAWEVSGSGAVKLREDATYGRIKVFCALFPAGLRLAEEDSLNVATFKTDDNTYFDVNHILERHVVGRANLLPPEQARILQTVLNHPEIRRRSIQERLRYVCAVLGEHEQNGQPVSWESAGAYLYELELVPDFALNAEIAPVQLARNAKCMSLLLDGEKHVNQNVQRLSKDGELDDDDRRRELMGYLADKNVLRPQEWLPDIAHEAATRRTLSFDEWQFANPVTGVNIELKPLYDPEKKKAVSGITYKHGELSNDGKKPIRITWKVTPPQAPELARLEISVVRQNDELGETDIIPPQTIPGKRKSFAVPIEHNDLDDKEKCVAIIRIRGLTKSGTPIGDAEDESEAFWIEKGDEELEEQPSERGQRIRHLDEVLFRAVYDTGNTYTVRNRGWDLKRQYVYSLRLSNNKRGDLTLNPLLLELERQLLEDPGNLGIYHANLLNKRQAKLEDFQPAHLSPAVNQIADAFYQARQRFFNAVRDQDDGRGVLESVDLHALGQEAQQYAEAYMKLLVQLKKQVSQSTGPSGINTVLHDYAMLLRIDTVLLQVGPQDQAMEVLLLSPTHPLRVLWLYQFESLTRGWIDKMEGKKPDAIKALIDGAVLEKLTSINMPNAVATGKGKAFVNTDNFGLFWGIYPAAETPDLRTAVNAALQVLNMGGGTISTVTPKQIADKLERYLCHHPYVQTLKLDVINPGDGQLLLDAIKLLLERPLYADLNFDLKFFSPATTRHQLVGNAFDDFMMQKTDADISRGAPISETEERLLRPNLNPLFPKLIYAKHTLEELLQERNGRFDAHISFVIDFFGTTVATRESHGKRESSALYNLLAEYVTDYKPGETSATWSRMVAPNQCPGLTSDGNTQRLYAMQDYLAHLSASVFEWGTALQRYLTVQLELSDAPDKRHLKLLDQVHETSDWVFTIDRNFGIEFYDNPIRGPGYSQGSYLIDYSPEFLDAVSHRLIISTLHQHEIESILRAGFADLLVDKPETRGEVIDSKKVADVLQVLKSVSGKLALKLINNPSQAQEVIGLALTRLALEQDDRLKNRVLIPLDSHINLFYQTAKELENADLSLKRTDLLLVELRDRHLHLELIEVKNRKASTPAEILALQEAVIDKNESTEKHFRHHYLGSGETRFDAPIKNKELANILLFYFERACRYGLFDEESTVRDAFRKGLQAVVAGNCEISFAHEGYIFNGANWGEIETKQVKGNTLHIVGRRGISNLLDVSLDEDEEDTPEADEPPPHETPPATTGSEPPQTTTPPEKPPVPQAKSPNETETTEKNNAHVKVYLGEDLTTAQPAYWDPHTTEPKRLLNQHLLIVGKSGAGKSETTKSMLYELEHQDIPAIIFDFQGEYAHEDFTDKLNPQVFDVMDGLPINPFEIPIDPRTKKRKRPVEMMFSLADTLNSVFSGSGDIQLGKLREAIKECYIQAGFDMNQPAPDDLEPPTLEMLSAILDKWAEETGGQVRNLKVRLQPLFESGIFAQGRADFSFEDLFKKTTVVLLTAGIKDLMLAASRFLLEKIYSAMLIEGMSKHLRVVVCVDEAHKLCNDPKITELAKEARKYGLGLILSSQETRDFHPAIFANAGTQIILALEDADAGIISKQFSTEKAEQKEVKRMIMEQDSGVALVRSNHFQPYAQIQVLGFEDRGE